MISDYHTIIEQGKWTDAYNPETISQCPAKAALTRSEIKMMLTVFFDYIVILRAMASLRQAKLLVRNFFRIS